MRKLYILLFVSVLYSLGAQTPSPIFHLNFNQTVESDANELPGYYYFFADDNHYSSGVEGQAVYLNHNNLVYPDSANIRQEKGTLEFWLRPLGWSTSGEYSILEYGGSGGMLFEKDAANNLRLILNRHSLNSLPEVDVAYNFPISDAWYHVAYTWGEDSLKLFVNGQLVDFDTYNFVIPEISASYFHVGSDGTGIFGPLSAMMDELYIYDTILSPEQIVTRFEAQEPDSIVTSCANILFELGFDMSSVSENQVAATDSSNLIYDYGKDKQGLLIHTNMQLNYPKAGNFDETNGTLEFWVNPNSYWTGGGEYEILSVGGAGGMLFAKDGANNLRLMVNRLSVNNQPELDVAYNVGGWDPESWYHVTYTWGNHELKLYVNGTLVDSDNYGTYDFPAIDAAHFNIGGVHNQSSTDGYWLDEIRIYNCVKSADDVLVSFLSGLNTIGEAGNNPDGPCTGTTFYLDMDYSLVDWMDWEYPTTATGINFTDGVYFSGVEFSNETVLRYAKAGNLNEFQGSLSFWIQPAGWQSNEEYTILECGGAGGMIFEKDGANNLRLIVNRFAVNGTPELDVAYNVHALNLNEWHFITYTWENSTLKLYVNGVLVDSDSFSYPFPVINATEFRIGNDDLGAEGPLRATLDELTLSGCAKSLEEVQAEYEYFRYVQGNTVVFDQPVYAPFPNPATDHAGIVLNGIESPTISIEDPNGIELFSMDSDDTEFVTIDISQLNPGVYFVKISSNGALISTEKLVKN